MPNTVALKARWVFPAVGPPIADAAVTVAGGRIVAVGEAPARESRTTIRNKQY